MVIDYIEIVTHFCNIINAIQAEQSRFLSWKWNDEFDEKPSDELLKNAQYDSDACYWSFERAFDRAQDVKNLIDLKDEDDFEYFALSNLRNTKDRIENFLNGTRLVYPDEVYDTHKYDDILINYYDTLKKKYNDDYGYVTSKYTNIEYRRINVNLGIVHDIDHQYNLLLGSKDGNHDKDIEILDKIRELVKQLSDFKSPTNKKSSFVNYERWQ